MGYNQLEETRWKILRGQHRRTNTPTESQIPTPNADAKATQRHQTKRRTTYTGKTNAGYRPGGNTTEVSRAISHAKEIVWHELVL